MTTTTKQKKAQQLIWVQGNSEAIQFFLMRGEKKEGNTDNGIAHQKH